MKVTRAKNCYCHTCDKNFHYLGINRHRAMHRDKRELCKITYTHGDTWIFDFRKPAEVNHEKEEITTGTDI